MDSKMPPIPSWVPRRVVDYAFEILDEEQYLLGGEGIRWFFEDENMKSAWEAIERRSDKVPPEKILQLMLHYSHRVSQFEAAQWGRDESEVRLANDLERAVNRYKDSFAFPFKTRNEKEVWAIIERLRKRAQADDDAWAEFDKYVGQRNAPDAKRIFLVRALANEFEKLYGTPLYRTVAAISAAILDDYPLDEDHVRKLVKADRR